MIHLDKTLGEMLSEIEFESVTFNDILVPRKAPCIFEIVKLRDGRRSFVPCDEYIDNLSDISNLPVHVLREVFLNSFERGNENDYNKSVKVKVYEGMKGNVTRIEDEGNGFDYKSIVESKRHNQKYYQRRGVGLYLLDQRELQVSFESRGNIVNIQSFLD